MSDEAVAAISRTIPSRSLSGSLARRLVPAAAGLSMELRCAGCVRGDAAASFIHRPEAIAAHHEAIIAGLLVELDSTGRGSGYPMAELMRNAEIDTALHVAAIAGLLEELQRTGLVLMRCTTLCVHPAEGGAAHHRAAGAGLLERAVGDEVSEACGDLSMG